MGLYLLSSPCICPSASDLLQMFGGLYNRFSSVVMGGGDLYCAREILVLMEEET